MFIVSTLWFALFGDIIHLRIERLNENGTCARLKSIHIRKFPRGIGRFCFTKCLQSFIKMFCLMFCDLIYTLTLLLKTSIAATEQNYKLIKWRDKWKAKDIKNATFYRVEQFTYLLCNLSEILWLLDKLNMTDSSKFESLHLFSSLCIKTFFQDFMHTLWKDFPIHLKSVARDQVFVCNGGVMKCNESIKIH